MKTLVVREVCLVIVCLLVGLLASPVVDAQQPQRLRIAVIAGEDAVNVIQQKTAVAPIVEVRDQNNNPVAGAAVTFALRGGDAKATLGNGLRQVVVTTDAAGRASVAVNPAASGAIEINATASMGGQTASTTITQTNVATAADAAKVSSGGGHTGLIVTSAVLAGAGVGGWKYYEKMKEEGDDEPAVQQGCFIGGVNGFTIPAAGGPMTHTIQTTCGWNAASDQSWLVLTGTTSGAANAGGLNQAAGQDVTLTFTVEPNPSTEQRIARITVTTTVHGPFVITITQRGRTTAQTFELMGPSLSQAQGCGLPVVIERMAIGEHSANVAIARPGCRDAVTSTSAQVSRDGSHVRVLFAMPDGQHTEFRGTISGSELRGAMVFAGSEVALSLAATQR